MSPSAERLGVRAARVRLAGGALGLLVAGVLAVVLLGGDLEAVRVAVAAAGVWGPVVYLVLHTLLTLLPVPKNLLAGIGGALFGLAGGVALSWLAAMASAVLAFGLARRFGRSAARSLTGPRLERVETLLHEDGLLAVFAARLTPVVPFAAVNYAAGASAVRLVPFVVGSAVGVLPGTVAYVAIGASAGEGIGTVLVAVGVGLALLAVAAVVGRGLLRHRGH